MNLNQYWRLDTAACLVVAVLAAWATARHPYSYYILVRWLAFVAGGYMTWRLYKSDDLGGVVVFGITAIAFNPIAPFRLRRETWETLDLICGAVFLYGAYLTGKLKPL